MTTLFAPPKPSVAPSKGASKLAGYKPYYTARGID
jgi:hypothetical protein